MIQSSAWDIGETPPVSRIWTSCHKLHHGQVYILLQTAPQAKGGCYLRTPGKRRVLSPHTRQKEGVISAHQAKGGCYLRTPGKRRVLSPHTRQKEGVISAHQAKGGCYLHTPGKCYNLPSRLQILVEAAIVRWREKLGSTKAGHQIIKCQYLLVLRPQK